MSKKTPDKPRTGPKPVVTVRKEELFLYELLCPPLERAFIKALHEDPDDTTTRMAYHDWLLEQGRDLSARMVLEGHVPGAAVHRPGPWGILSGAIASGAIFPTQRIIFGSGSIVS